MKPLNTSAKTTHCTPAKINGGGGGLNSPCSGAVQRIFDLNTHFHHFSNSGLVNAAFCAHSHLQVSVAGCSTRTQPLTPVSSTLQHPHTITYSSKFTIAPAAHSYLALQATPCTLRTELQHPVSCPMQHQLLYINN